MNFTTKHLKKLINEGSLVPQLRNDVAYALELPLNWRVQRLHTRWFIESSQKKKTIKPDLLELARLDFNLIQSIYGRELQQLSRYKDWTTLLGIKLLFILTTNFDIYYLISWWTNLGLAQKLPFFRDWLTENYLWSVGWMFDPEESTLRSIETKANCFITLIDDVYDVYGTLDELQLFTDAIDR